MASHVAVIDPAMRIPELDCFNRMSRSSPVPLTYHLTGLFGLDSLVRDEDGLVGLVILGSGASVNDDLPWQHALFDWLRPRLQGGTPTLGLCYGHQAVAHLLGGRVDFLTADRVKRKGLRDVTLRSNPLWGEERTVSVLVSHREVVVDVPDVVDIVGRSAEVANEAIAHRTLPIWGFQAHPEATAAFARNNDVPFDGPPGRLAGGHALVDAFLRRFQS
jgi:GMP synthase-like glutamine amidotransferase